MVKKTEENLLSQEDLDSLLRINEFIDEEGNKNSLIGELKRAILDSGQLELGQWQSLRDHIREIETLIPHIDLIIKLKKEAKL